MNVKLIGLALSGFVLLGTAFYIYHLRAENARLAVENSRLDEQIEIATLEINQCISDKALTERVSNDYKNANVALRRERDRLRNNPACILPEPSSPSGVPSSGGRELSGKNGIRVDWLYDFAGDAEQDRLTAVACMDFVNQLYQSRGLNQ